MHIPTFTYHTEVLYTPIHFHIMRTDSKMIATFENVTHNGAHKGNPQIPEWNGTLIG